MSQPIRRLIFFGALFFHAHFISAQVPEAEYRELIVQVPGIVNSRGFPEIRNKLIALPGVHVVAFCESEQLIMIKIRKKNQADNRPVFSAISELDYKFHVKEGATIKKAMNACKDKLYKFNVPELPSE